MPDRLNARVNDETRAEVEVLQHVCGGARMDGVNEVVGQEQWEESGKNTVDDCIK